MKVLLMSAIVAATVLASAATVLRSHTGPVERPGTGSLSLPELYAAAGVNRLPIENFEDRFDAYTLPAKP